MTTAPHLYDANCHSARSELCLALSRPCCRLSLDAYHNLFHEHSRGWEVLECIQSLLIRNDMKVPTSMVRHNLLHCNCVAVIQVLS